MDQVKASQMVKAKQRLQDEMDDLSPESITSDVALDMKDEVKRIWEMKNDFRDGVRDLVAILPTEDSVRIQWEQSSKEMVDKVISFRLKVLAAIERARPVEQLTEYQKRSLALQEKAIEENRTVRKEQEESAKKINWAEARVRLDAFRDHYNVLVAELAVDQLEVKNRDDMTVSQNIQDLQAWK